MNWFKIIFAAALAIILVSSTLIALFGAGQTVNAVLRTYVFGVEDCRFNTAPRTVDGTGTQDAKEEETCEIDYNQAKRDIANGVGMFIIAAPLAAVMFWQTRRMMKD